MAEKTLDIAIILGSQSDEKVLEESGILALFDEFQINWEMSVLSAHRHSGQLQAYCVLLRERDVKVIIAVVGLKADLPSAVKAQLPYVPVIGVPLTDHDGFCDVAGLIHMPPGLPVMVVGTDKEGLIQAAYAALAIALDTVKKNIRFSEHFQRKEDKKPRPPEVAKKYS